MIIWETLWCVLFLGLLPFAIWWAAKLFNGDIDVFGYETDYERRRKEAEFINCVLPK